MYCFNTQKKIQVWYNQCKYYEKILQYQNKMHLNKLSKIIRICFHRFCHLLGASKMYLYF